MLMLHKFTTQVVISKEEDCSYLLFEPPMNIEEIATEALDILNDGHREGGNNGAVGRSSGRSSRALDHDDPFVIDGRNAYGHLSPRPIDPSQFYVVDKIPLNNSLVSQILDDGSMEEIFARLRREDARQEDVPPIQLRPPFGASTRHPDNHFIGFLSSQPSPLAARSAEILRIDERDSNRKKRKQSTGGSIDGDGEAHSWEVPNTKIRASQESKKSRKERLSPQSATSARSNARDTSTSAMDDDENDDDDDSSFDDDDEGGESESDVNRFRRYQYEQWQEKFEELCKFQKEHGHCNVPGKPRRKRKAVRKKKSNSTPNPSPEMMMLWRWVKRQKYQYKLFQEGKQSTLSQERINALEGIGITWDCHTSTWTERLAELAKYHSENGDCNVPSKYPPNPKLSTWVKVSTLHISLSILPRQLGFYSIYIQIFSLTRCYKTLFMHSVSETTIQIVQ